RRAGSPRRTKKHKAFLRICAANGPRPIGCSSPPDPKCGGGSNAAPRFVTPVNSGILNSNGERSAPESPAEAQRPRRIATGSPGETPQLCERLTGHSGPAEREEGPMNRVPWEAYARLQASL